MKPISIALIGCGAIAAKHIASIAACPGAQLAAVCDVSIERMEQMAALWRTASDDKHEIACFTDYRQLLAEPSFDVVVIATISGLHARIATEALMANKHVVIEKPIALSLREVDEMIRIAGERKLIVQVCHQLRYRPIMKKINELVTGGALGNILTASVKLRINRPPGYYQSSGWRGTWELDGGMLLNQGIHAIDLLLWNLGTPDRIYGELLSSHSFKETEDAAVGILTFKNGAKAMIEANSITLPDNLEQSLFLLGEKGVISVGGPRLDRIDRWYIEDRPTAGDEAEKILHDHSEHLKMYRTLVGALQGNSEAEASLIGLSEGRRALETIFALYLSAATEKMQYLPIAGFSTLQMKS